LFIRYKKYGLPPTAKLVLPNETFNLWNGLKSILPQYEKNIIKEWSKPLKNNILLVGCFTQIFPYLTDSSLLESLNPRGTEKFWCNAGHIYQLGLFNIVDKIGEILLNKYKSCGIKKIITFMEAEYSMIKNIFPIFGHHIDIELETLSHYLLERIRNGDIKLRNRLRGKITIHDNCFSKSLGEDSWNINRDLVKELGLEIYEMKHNKKSSLCCGFGAACYSFSVLDIIKQAQCRLIEAKSVNVQAIVVYCSACLFILSVAKELLQIKIPIFHVFELVQLAMGEKPIHNHSERAWDIISIFTIHLIYSIFSKRFKIKNNLIPENSELKLSFNFNILKIINKLLKIKLLRHFYVCSLKDY